MPSRSDLGRRKFLKVAAGVVAGVGLGFSGALFAKYSVRLLNARTYLGTQTLGELADFLKEIEVKHPALYSWLGQRLGSDQNLRDHDWPIVRELNQLYFAEDRLRRLIGYQSDQGTPGVWREVAFETYTVSLEKN